MRLIAFVLILMCGSAFAQYRPNSLDTNTEPVALNVVTNISRYQVTNAPTMYNPTNRGQANFYDSGIHLKSGNGNDQLMIQTNASIVGAAGTTANKNAPTVTIQGGDGNSDGGGGDTGNGASVVIRSGAEGDSGIGDGGNIVLTTGSTPNHGNINLYAMGIDPERAVATDSSTNLVTVDTTRTQLGYLSDVTSAIQAQLNGKQSTLLNPLTNGQTTLVTLVGGLTVSNASTTVSATANTTTSNLLVQVIGNGSTNQFRLNPTNGMMVNINGVTVFSVSTNSTATLSDATSGVTNTTSSTKSSGNLTIQAFGGNLFLRAGSGSGVGVNLNSSVLGPSSDNAIDLYNGANRFRNAAFGGIITNNGLASLRSNLLAPTSITFPASNANWTNPLPVNIEVYIDNTGVTGTVVKKNGTQIFGSLASDVTLGLQPGEYFSETYTVGTPTATYSPQ